MSILNTGFIEESYEISIALSINLLRNYLAFHDSPYIYAYYVMSSRKFSDVLVFILNSSRRLSSCIFKNEIS